MKKTFLYIIIYLLLGSSGVMAQLKMKKMSADGSPSKFMEEHPEYVFLNKPERDLVTGFDYYISEMLNPTSLGLNKNNYYIIIEGINHRGKPNTLIWDGTLKSKLVKKMNTSNRQVVFFKNLWILEEKDLLYYYSDGLLDEGYEYTLKFSLSGNGVTDACGKWQKHTVRGKFFNFTNLKTITPEWTDNPAEWLSIKKAVSPESIYLQEPTALQGKNGWFLDFSHDTEERLIRGYKMTFCPTLELWKDKDHTIPLNFCIGKVSDSSQGEDGAEELIFSNTVKLNENFPRLKHQYYFLDSNALINASEKETMPNGNTRLTAYYTAQAGAKETKHWTAHLLVDKPEEGVLTLEVLKTPPTPTPRPNQKHEKEEKKKKNSDVMADSIPSQPSRPTQSSCPPHKFRIVSKKTEKGTPFTTVVEKIYSEMPPTRTFTFGNKKMQFKQQVNADGSYYYMASEFVNSDVWKYGMQEPDNIVVNISYNDVMKFLIGLNEMARNSNISYMFTLPTYEEVKRYYKEAGNSIYDEILIDSISEENGKIYWGCMTSDDEFARIDIEGEDNLMIKILLKAIPDNQMIKKVTTKETRRSLIKYVTQRCTKCGIEITSVSTVGITNTSGNVIGGAATPSQNILALCDELMELDDVDEIKQNLKDVGFQFMKDLLSSDMIGFNSNYKDDNITIKKVKKTTKLKELEVTLKNPNENISWVKRKLTELGYTPVQAKKKDLQNFHYYGFSNDQRHIEVEEVNMNGKKHIYCHFTIIQE